MGRGLLAAGVVLAALAGFALTQAARQALLAADDVQQARAGLTAVVEGGVDLDAAALALRDAQRQVERAQLRLAAREVGLVAAVPVLGRSLRAEQAVVRAAGHTLAAAAVALQGVEAVRGPSGGGLDTTALGPLQTDLAPRAERAQTSVRALSDLRLGLTPPQVRDAVAQARPALAEAADGLVQVAAGAGLADELLGSNGPQRILLLLQNNAELRATGGYASTFGVLTTERGKVTVSPLRDLTGLRDPTPRARTVPAPPEFVEDYRVFVGNTTAMHNWNLTPDVPTAAAVAAAAMGVLLDTRFDAAVLLDVRALASLAQLTGGVRLPDGRVLAERELLEALLVDSYEAAGADVLLQQERRAQLRAAATASLTALLDGGLSDPDALRDVARLTRGRHLALWSARPGTQEVVRALGLAGEVDGRDGDLLAVTTSNFGSNKIDYYVRRRVEVRVVVGRDSAEVTQTLVLDNEAPDGLVPYVAGTPYGLSRNRVEFDLPAAAELTTLRRDGEDVRGAIAVGPPRTRVSLGLDVARGRTGTVSVGYRLPLVEGRYRLRTVPQPLARDAPLRLDITAAPGLVLEPGPVRREELFSETGELRLRAR